MNLLQAFKKTREETDGDLSKECLAILRNHSDPNSDKNAARLIDIFDLLGLDGEKIELFLIVVSEHDRLLADAKPIGKLETKLAAVKADQQANERKFAELESARKKITDRAASLEEQSTAIQGALSTAESRRSEAKAIANQFSSIFSDEGNGGHTRPWWQPSTVAIAEVQERLGISRKASDHE